MVGHTHEDVDQLFSCISRQLNRVNALTLVELLKQIGLSYSPSINASILSFMFDVKQWMEKFVEPNLTGHVDQHQFKVICYVMPFTFFVINQNNSKTSQSYDLLLFARQTQSGWYNVQLH